MTSLNPNYSHKITKSDLLQKYIASPASQTPALQTSDDLYQKNGSKTKKTQAYQIKGEKKKSKKAKIAAGALSGTLFLGVLTVAGAFGLKGKAPNKFFGRISDRITSFVSQFSDPTKTPRLNKFLKKAYANDKVDITSTLENVTNVKDVATKGFFGWLGKVTKGKISFYSALDEKVSGFYKQQGLNTLVGKFKGVVKKFTSLDKRILSALKGVEKASNLQETVVYKGEEVTKGSLIELARQKIAQRQEKLAAFSSENVTTRYNALDKYMTETEGGLSDRTGKSVFQRLRKFNFKSFFKESVAGSLIQEKKAEHAAEVTGFRKGITNSLVNVLEGQKASFDRLYGVVDPEDIDSLKALRETIRLFDDYSRRIYDTQEASKKAQDEVLKKLTDLKSIIGKSKTRSSQADWQKVTRTIDELKTSVAEIQPGETEELAEILKLLLDKETYTKTVKRGTAGAVNALNKACRAEVTDTVDKLRDINCGSGPTDILGVALSAASLGVYTAMADDNDERVGIVLSTGMPILSAIATCMIGAIKQVSGKKVLLMGGLASFATKVLGDGLNRMYRKAKGLNENQKPSVVTIDDYMKPYVNKFEEIFFVEDEEAQENEYQWQELQTDKDGSSPIDDQSTYVPSSAPGVPSVLTMPLGQSPVVQRFQENLQNGYKF